MVFVFVFYPLKSCPEDPLNFPWYIKIHELIDHLSFQSTF